VSQISPNAECHYDIECHYAECHYAECRYAECRGALGSPDERHNADMPKTLDSRVLIKAWHQCYKTFFVVPDASDR